MKLILALLSSFTFYFALAQYGEIDPSFGNNGFVEIAIGPYLDSKIRDTKLDSEQNIFSVGSAHNGTFSELFVLKLLPNGSPDNSFSGDGKATIPSFNTNTFGTCLSIDSQNRIVVAGHHYAVPYQQVFLARFLSNGTIDNTFGENGTLSIPIGNNNAYCNDVTIDNNDRIVIAGYVNFDNLGEDFFVMRFDNTGNFDTSFGNNGIVGNVNDISSGYHPNLAIQEDNKIIVAGTGGIAGTPHYCVLRFNTDGSLDSDFNNDGIVTTFIAGEYNSPYGVALRSDGSIITGGLSGYWQSVDISFSQYSDNGDLDTSFGNNGTLTQNVNGGTDQVTDLILQPDEKMLASVATVGPDGTYDYFVIRYNVDGTLDNTFGLSGLVQVEFPNIDARAESLVLQNDGKIVVAGYSQTINTNYTAFVRLSSGLPVDIDERTSKPSTQIYPNPTTHYLTIRDNHGPIGSVRFFDIYGKEIHPRCAQSDKSQWDLSSLSSGNYFLQITIGDDITCHPFMIMEE
jgi:uncharacterized delta-60 repeat protein